MRCRGLPGDAAASPRPRRRAPTRTFCSNAATLAAAWSGISYASGNEGGSRKRLEQARLVDVVHACACACSSRLPCTAAAHLAATHAGGLGVAHGCWALRSPRVPGYATIGPQGRAWGVAAAGNAAVRTPGSVGHCRRALPLCCQCPRAGMRAVDARTNREAGSRLKPYVLTAAGGSADNNTRLRMGRTSERCVVCCVVCLPPLLGLHSGPPWGGGGLRSLSL